MTNDKHTTLRRTTAWIAAVVYLFAYLSGFAHDLEERHVECEHGHQIHLDDDHHEATEDEEAPVTIAAIPADAHGDHDHCGLIVVSQTPRILVEAPALTGIVELDAVHIDDIAIPQAPIRGPTVAIWALAPKTSPPTIT